MKQFRSIYQNSIPRVPLMELIFTKKNRAFADLRYLDKDNISLGSLIFVAIMTELYSCEKWGRREGGAEWADFIPLPSVGIGHSSVRARSVQCSEVHSTVLQFNVVRCRAMWCSAVRCDAVQCSAVQCGVVHCCALRCSAVQCSLLYWGIVQCSAA